MRSWMMTINASARRRPRLAVVGVFTVACSIGRLLREKRFCGRCRCRDRCRCRFACVNCSIKRGPHERRLVARYDNFKLHHAVVEASSSYRALRCAATCSAANAPSSTPCACSYYRHVSNLISPRIDVDNQLQLCIVLPYGTRTPTFSTLWLAHRAAKCHCGQRNSPTQAIGLWRRVGGIVQVFCALIAAMNILVEKITSI